MSAWSKNKNVQENFRQPVPVSKDGIQNLKARFYETPSSKPDQNYQSLSIQSSYQDSSSSSSHPSYNLINKFESSSNNQFEMPYNQSPQVNRVKLNKLSSHENYLFNSRNAVQAMKNQTNYYNDDSIAASDL